MPNRIKRLSVFAAPILQLIEEIKFVDTLKGTTTPDISTRKVFKCGNTAAITVTEFKNGTDGDVIYLLGESFTTIQNGTKIKTNTGANKLLAANKIYCFVQIDGVFYEH